MRYIITAIIFTATVATIILGTSFVSDFAKSMTDLSDSVIYSIDKNDILSAEKHLSQMSDSLKKNENLLMMFTDHALTEELKKRISSALVLVRNQESPLAASEIIKARELMNDMSEETHLSFGNVF